MALLTTQTIPSTGVTPTYAAATSGAGGDTFTCDGDTFLVVKNGGGSSITVTIASQFPDRVGAIHSDITVTVAAGAEKWIGNIEPAYFADSTGVAKATYSAVTSVTVAALRCV